MNKPIEYCCDVFPKIMNRFKWFSFTNDDTDQTVLVMPCIGGTDYRVNNCPSCGTVVRSIQLTEEQFIQDQTI